MECLLGQSEFSGVVTGDKAHIGCNRQGRSTLIGTTVERTAGNGTGSIQTRNDAAVFTNDFGSSGRLDATSDTAGYAICADGVERSGLDRNHQLGVLAKVGVLALRAKLIVAIDGGAQHGRTDAL